MLVYEINVWKKIQRNWSVEVEIGDAGVEEGGKMRRWMEMKRFGIEQLRPSVDRRLILHEMMETQLSTNKSSASRSEVPDNQQPNVKKTKKRCVPFNIAEEIHFGRTFWHFSTNTSASSYTVALAIVALNLLSWVFFFSTSISDSWPLLKSENLPPAVKCLF